MVADLNGFMDEALDLIGGISLSEAEALGLLDDDESFEMDFSMEELQKLLEEDENE